MPPRISTLNIFILATPSLFPYKPLSIKRIQDQIRSRQWTYLMIGSSRDYIICEPRDDVTGIDASGPKRAWTG